MQKEILKAVANGEDVYTAICGNGAEMLGAWLALSDAIARALEEKPLLKGADQRQAMLELLSQSFKDKEFVKHTTDNYDDCDDDDEYDDDDDDDDDCSDCAHCDMREECEMYNKAIKKGLSNEEAMLLALLGKIIGGKKQ
mgnify:CR=1 FL=1